MTLQEQIRANRRRTAVVFLGFAVLILAFVAIIGGAYSPGLAGVLGIFMIGYGLISYFASGRIIAAVSHAKPVTKQDQPRVYRLLENVAIAAGLPQTPDLYLIDDSSPNAFAAGRDPKHAYVAVTSGLLALMDDRELEGVLAHEVGHIRNRDVKLMSIAAVLVGAIALAADMLMRITIFGGSDSREGGLGALGVAAGLIAAVLAPIGASLLQMSLSRRREYLADAAAVEFTGDAEGLALALAALRDDHQPLQARDAGDGASLHRVAAARPQGPALEPGRHVRHAPAARGPDRDAREDRRLHAPRRRAGRRRADPGRSRPSRRRPPAVPTPSTASRIRADSRAPAVGPGTVPGTDPGTAPGTVPGTVPGTRRPGPRRVTNPSTRSRNARGSPTAARLLRYRLRHRAGVVPVSAPELSSRRWWRSRPRRPSAPPRDRRRAGSRPPPATRRPATRSGRARRSAPTSAARRAARRRSAAPG